jgi:hypothetical protein
VAEREKDIRYRSRTRAATSAIRETHDVRHNINTLWHRLPQGLCDTPKRRFLYAYACVTTMDIAQLFYRPAERQGNCKDYEFSRGTMEERSARRLADAEATLEVAPWLAPMRPELGARTFDVVGDCARDASVRRATSQAATGAARAIDHLLAWEGATAIAGFFAFSQLRNPLPLCWQEV